MITTAIKLRKQLMPTWNCFLLLRHFEKNKSCMCELSPLKAEAYNISSPLLEEAASSSPERVIPDYSPHVEEEILLYLDTTYGSEAATAKSGGEKSKEADLSYKNRNIYNTKYGD